jgi:hypothetical protein
MEQLRQRASLGVSIALTHSTDGHGATIPDPRQQCNMSLSCPINPNAAAAAVASSASSPTEDSLPLNRRPRSNSSTTPPTLPSPPSLHQPTRVNCPTPLTRSRSRLRCGHHPSGTSPIGRFPPPQLRQWPPRVPTISTEPNSHALTPPMLDHMLRLNWRHLKPQHAWTQYQMMRGRYSSRTPADIHRWRHLFRTQHECVSDRHDRRTILHPPQDLRSACAASYVHSHVHTSVARGTPFLPCSIMRSAFGAVGLVPPIVVAQEPFRHQMQDVWILLLSLLPYSASRALLVNCCGEGSPSAPTVYWPERVGESLLFCDGNLKVTLQKSSIIQSHPTNVDEPWLIRRDFFVSRLHAHCAVAQRIYVTQVHFVRWQRGGQIPSACLATGIQVVLDAWKEDVFMVPPVIHCTHGEQRCAVVVMALTLAKTFQDLPLADVDLVALLAHFRQSRQSFLSSYRGLLLAIKSALICGSRAIGYQLSNAASAI